MASGKDDIAGTRLARAVGHALKRVGMLFDGASGDVCHPFRHVGHVNVVIGIEIDVEVTALGRYDAVGGHLHLDAGILDDHQTG